MANFKTHISTGFFIGALCAICAIIFGVTTNWNIVILIILFISIGSIFPDIDSDSSIPFRITFYLLAGFASVFSFLMLSHYYSYTLLTNIIISAFIFIFVRFGIGAIFKRFTHHRGIFHSIPMAILTVLGALYFFQSINIFSYQTQLILSTGITIGFIIHLILDEIYATVNFNGKKFHPNKNLGSALKLWSNSLYITLIVYILIGIFLYLNIF